MAGIRSGDNQPTPDAAENAATWLDLYDYRLRMANLYAGRARRLVAGADERETLERFRAAKDALFASHPQSPLDPAARTGFTGLRYFPYDPALRIIAEMTPDTSDTDETLPSSGAHSMRFRRAARVSFALAGVAISLPVYWIDVYGGGLFLPFRDATCPTESYGAGRYLFDTVKGSDFLLADETGRLVALDKHDGDKEPMSVGAMGFSGGRIILDFNYAYNPSCAYDPRWACPLAPRENILSMPIRAGERKYHDDE